MPQLSAHVEEFRGHQVVIRPDEGAEIVVDVPWEATRIEVGMPVTVTTTTDGGTVVHWEPDGTTTTHGRRGSSRRLVALLSSFVRH